MRERRRTVFRLGTKFRITRTGRRLKRPRWRQSLSSCYGSATRRHCPARTAKGWITPESTTTPRRITSLNISSAWGRRWAPVGPSPYVCGDPVKTDRPELFVGREELLDDLLV